ncbi:Mitochondrial import inner membrane translocase subunit [Nymphaea thermarum]|nr:Mitochondrial import inner membrane translocase subunit [Nymphaea thermarum]
MATNNTPTAFDKEQIIGMAEKEMEYRVDLFNRYKESELNMGENSCIDRCVSKYWQAGNFKLAVLPMDDANLQANVHSEFERLMLPKLKETKKKPDVVKVLRDARAAARQGRWRRIAGVGGTPDRTMSHAN